MFSTSLKDANDTQTIINAKHLFSSSSNPHSTTTKLKRHSFPFCRKISKEMMLCTNSIFVLSRGRPPFPFIHSIFKMKLRYCVQWQPIFIFTSIVVFKAFSKTSSSSSSSNNPCAWKISIDNISLFIFISQYGCHIGSLNLHVRFRFVETVSSLNASNTIIYKFIYGIINKSISIGIRDLFWVLCVFSIRISWAYTRERKKRSPILSQQNISLV